MSTMYVFTPQSLVPLIGPAWMVVGVIYLWQYRDMPGARALQAYLLMGAGHYCALALGAAAVVPSVALFWLGLASCLAAFSTVTTTFFALEYTYPGRWVTPRSVVLLSLPPIIYVVALLIHNLQLINSGVGVVTDGGLLSAPMIARELMEIYSLLLTLVNLAAFGWLFVRSPQHRWFVALMVAAWIVLRIPFLLGVTGLALPTTFDLASITLVLGFISYTAAIGSFRIFDPLPAARQAVVEQIHAGLLVFDPRWRILSLNPAAEGILGVPAAATRRKTWRQIAPPEVASEPALAPCAPGGEERDLREMTIRSARGSDVAVRYYAPTLSDLRDFRGLVLGHLLLLRDVTSQRRVQTQLLEQRWAQATLQERAQLAHELHDGISQSLAFLNVQAQAADLYAETGQDDEARAALRRLAEVSREMQDEVRELIGNLLEVSLPSEGFAGTLGHILAQYQERNGIPVSLDMDDPAGSLADGSRLPAATGMQLVRIVQEALANTRKHGAADRVSVQVHVADEQVLLVVADNGKGFDTNGPRPGEHFGLQVMQQRAEGVGGQLVVRSAPGQGTRVEVCAPLGTGGVEVVA